MKIECSQPIQVAYVLTSSGEDIYADMNLISLRSLRYSNPQTRVVLVCDSQTVQALELYKHKILEEADEVVSVNSSSQSASFRNRFVKTSLRQHLTGSFLYLDGDTLIRDDLSQIFLTNAFLAGVPNHNGSGSHQEIPGTELEVFEKFNWSSPSHYVNGGVLYFSDQPDTYIFCNLWHEKWLECSTQTGKHFDQPSLNSAIKDSEISFTWLDHRFNAQVHARPHTAWGAAIWHIYFSGHHATPKTVLEKALEKSKHKYLISAVEVARFCQRPHPWLVSNPLDWLAISSMKSDQNIFNGDRWERLWLADKYGLFLKHLSQQVRIYLCPRHRLASLRRILG
jgi:hypothetical protein